MIRQGAMLVAFLLLFTQSVVRAETTACNQARAIVDEVKTQLAGAHPDHISILKRLATARDLCSSLGEAWKYSYCSATSLGDLQKARFYKDQAIFNGVSQVECDDQRGAAASAALPSFVRQKYALVVGVGRFRDPSIPQLQFASKDAKDLAAVLTDSRFGHFNKDNVTLLTDDQATRANILNALQAILLSAHEDDLVFMYISSHGSPRQQERGLGGIGYIVTYDTSVKNIWLEAIEYEDFAKKAALIKARRKVVFLDTCYSGQTLKPGDKGLSIEGLGIEDKTAKMFLSGEGTYVITSSKDKEKSYESDGLRNSYFTYYLIDALKRGEQPTIKEVFNYLARRVPDAVAQDKQAPQNPQMHPLDGAGDVRIGVIPKPD
ncbi:MAG TPA: caspase family protein [Thermoanaerobaculia bacterium]|nr:caspase family protein [Thermoanaerobaculia bacterium]